MLRTTMIVACLLVTAGQAAAQSQATIQEGVHQAGIKMAEAFNKGDAKALAALYTEDAYLLPPGAGIIHGRSAIEAFWREHLKFSDFKYITIDIRPLGDKAAREIGTTSVRTNDQQLHETKWAVVWVNNGGQWQLLQDIWNAK
jgi:uncharacterized protein (TIGR02246 family)